MAPLTSKPCEGCLRLTQIVSSLKGRISQLHSIRESELFLDSWYETSKAQEIDSTGPVIRDASTENPPTPLEVAEPSTLPCAAAPSPGSDSADSEIILNPRVTTTTAVEELDDTVPFHEADARWIREGAKHKCKAPPVNSTPVQWNKVAPKKHGRKIVPPPHQFRPPPLVTTNSFSVLAEDFPPLPTVNIPHPPLSTKQAPQPSPSPSMPQPAAQLSSSTVSLNQVTAQSSIKASARLQLLKSAVKRSEANEPKTANAVKPSPVPLVPLIPPTTLIVGDSIVKNIRFINVVTHCFPGATIPDILKTFPGLVSSLPPSINKIIIHVGSNDTSRRESESMKLDFMRLIDMTNSCGKSVFLSGPIPTLGRGVGRFSRILSLHTWLSSFCSSHKVAFIDNFNLFWNRAELFSPDGLHPNPLGTRVLADNMRHAIVSSPRAL